MLQLGDIQCSCLRRPQIRTHALQQLPQPRHIRRDSCYTPKWHHHHPLRCPTLARNLARQEIKLEGTYKKKIHLCDESLHVNLTPREHGERTQPICTTPTLPKLYYNSC